MGLFDTFRVKDQKIDLHTPAVYAGMLVRGVFSFSTTSNVSSRAVRIKLAGRERTHVEQSSGSGKNRRTHHYYGTTILHKELFTISGDTKINPTGKSSELPSGTYAIPFEFYLPHGLPSSGRATTAHNYAVVEYQLKAYIDIPYGPDAKVRVPLQVLATMPIGQYMTRSIGGIPEPLNVPVTCCCCISKGSVKFSAQADKNIISLDRPDPVTVTVWIDNSNGEEPVNAIVVSFENRSTFNACGHTRCAITRVSSVRQPVTIAKGASQNVTVTVPIGPGQQKHEVFTTLHPSMVGKLIQSHWVVATELDIPYAADPIIAFPIVVTPRVDDSNQAPPLDWSRNTYPDLSKGQMKEFAYLVPPVMENFARGLDVLPGVTGGAPTAPYGGRIRCGDRGGSYGSTAPAAAPGTPASIY
ncbi:arrestin-like protein, putative [Bodo saltans]|uniref:Arrestin-like protein, putative n=1 Tax=Bodo saltans TaxID=75058 RepID=A0A0S4J277_BODSA|nr:arrestin-like protein, putative [Bodo saltans]|eukprot:CUG60782.1 arrestin-like protein, putative [Bodo saltans]